MDTLRAFIAIDMPKSMAEFVQCKQEALRREGLRLRWVPPENLHLTLRFLGDISSDDLTGIRHAVEHAAINSGPFTLFLKGAGVFPKRGQPTVVWFGLGGDLTALAELHRGVNAFLGEQGLPLEKRPFKGHLTIGRIKDRVAARDLHRKLETLGDIQATPFTVSRICLYQSDLKPGGAVYTALDRTELGTAQGTV